MKEYFEFATKDELELWREELLGQLSDGQYKCSYVNWQFWHRLKTEIGIETKVHCNEQIIMDTKIDFTELYFLFDEEHSRKKDIRCRFGGKKNKKLIPYLQKISDAMNEFAVIDKNYEDYYND